MNSFLVEEFYEFSKAPPQIFLADVVAEKYPLILQRHPRALDEDVVLAPSYTVHAYFHTI